MKIQCHRDQVYKKNGDFDDNKNSQLQHTVTAILCIGSSHDVDFTLELRELHALVTSYRFSYKLR